MIRITQVKMPITHTYDDLLIRTAKLLRIPDGQLRGLHIVKQSIDARKREDIRYVYVLDVEVDREKEVIRRCRNKNAALYSSQPYVFPHPGDEVLTHPPVVVGSGPAGLFCSLMLARHGFRPILLERGGPVEERMEKVDRFWKTGELDEECNVQFGEGGAGTFSDGKLNTLVKDPAGRNQMVLKIFAQYGADPSICYMNKPHIGTDELQRIIPAMRQAIIQAGGQVRFHAKVTDLSVEKGRINGVEVNGNEFLPSQAVVFAVGHSARDTFRMLLKRQVPMEAKAFAVGLRVQHPQKMIDESQYGSEAAQILGPASYKVTHQCVNGRGVYSFCMCPGGYVVNASSQKGRLAVNGMSYHARDGKNANSALIVTVKPEDFGGGGPLAGVEFQERMEEAAYQAGKGKIPVQLYGDFCEGRVSQAYGQVEPAFQGETAFADLNQILPKYAAESIKEGMESFGNIIEGFNRPDAVLAGVESRTSSPIRISRDKSMESDVKGLFPCGEGAGYAGGITSAAMDGLKTAEEICRRFKPFDQKENEKQKAK